MSRLPEGRLKSLTNSSIRSTARLKPSHSKTSPSNLCTHKSALHPNSPSCPACPWRLPPDPESCPSQCSAAQADPALAAVAAPAWLPAVRPDLRLAAAASLDRLRAARLRHVY